MIIDCVYDVICANDRRCGVPIAYLCSTDGLPEAAKRGYPFWGFRYVLYGVPGMVPLRHVGTDYNFRWGKRMRKERPGAGAEGSQPPHRVIDPNMDAHGQIYCLDCGAKKEVSTWQVLSDFTASKLVRR